MTTNRPIQTQQARQPRSWPTSRRALIGALTGGIAGGNFIFGWGDQNAGAQEGSLATPVPLGPAVPPEISTYGVDWPAPQGNLAAHRAATASSISAATVDRLHVAWRLPLTASGPYGSMTGTPIVAGETVYAQDTEGDVFAIDRETGAVRWRHEEGMPTAGPNGVAIGYGLIFAGNGFNAEVFALNAETGEEVWRSKLSANPYEWTLAQPVVHDSVVYTGTSPGAYAGGSRGSFFALDVGTGVVLWEWDTTTDNLWGNARLNSGGGLWYPPSVDEAGNIYFGTGNPAPWPETVPLAESTRPGGNLYSSSMVSLDPETGSLRWFVQAAAHDQLDHDFQNTPILASVTVDETPLHLAIGSGKTGTVIAANADSGEVVWRASVGTHNDYGDGAELPVPSATPVTVAPGFYGGVLTPPAFAADTIYVPVVNLPFTYSDTASEFDLVSATGEMVALDAADGTPRWSTPIDTLFIAGATVVNDLVFGAGLDGIVRGFDAATGREIWQFQAAAGINAPPAIAGDTLIVPAGAQLLNAGPEQAQPELIALRLGKGTPAATS